MQNHAYFCKYGPFIATCFTVLWMHIFFIFDAETLSHLSLPLLLGMFILMIPSLIVGYVIGIIPNLITGFIFFKLLQRSKLVLTHRSILKYGLGAGLCWLPFGIFAFLIDLSTGMFSLGFVLLVIVPTAILCAHLEWKAHQPSPIHTA